jgi:hypothetical protein
MKSSSIRTVPYNLRLGMEIAERIQEEADRSGLPATDIITLALQERYGLAKDPAIALLAEVAKWVTANYQPDKFPEDLILIASRHIRDTPHLYKMYQSAIGNAEGRPDPGLKRLVLQKVGRCVKRAIQGETYARSLMMPTSDDLIGTFSLLRPSTTPVEAPDKTVAKKGRKKS